MKTNSSTINLNTIGKVQRKDDNISVIIDQPYRPALRKLDTFSHVIVFWWAQQFDSEEHRSTLVTPLPYADGQEAGVFASRSPIRPNLIMTTVCEILAVDEDKGIVQIANIDAFDMTPVLDLKAYFPVMDRVKDAHISDYLEGWPEWIPDQGMGLMEHEV